MSTDNFSPQVPSTVYLDYMEQGIAARKAEAESNASTKGRARIIQASRLFGA